MVFGNKAVPAEASRAKAAGPRVVPQPQAQAER